MPNMIQAMNAHVPFDAELLRRYERPGPRYTSYPTAPQFSDKFKEADLLDVIRRSNEDPIPRPLSLYVHVPFCSSPCFYCGCNRIITRDEKRGEQYIQDLMKEVAMVSPLFERDREVTQLHFGGGTPNFLSPTQLGEFMDFLLQHFHFSTSANLDISIEIDPRCVMPDDIAALAFMGFNRASLGVQDFDPDVQAAVNRIQSVEETLDVIKACRENGFKSVNVDLIYGLPKQTPEGFGKTLDTVIAARPDRIALYSYAHMPQLFKAQRQLDETLLPSGETKLSLLQLAIEKLSEAGYCYIGMDHFALPEDDLAIAQSRGDLHRNFMGYTTHADSDLVGLGVSSISHIGESFSQNPRDLPSWEANIESGHLPIWRGMRLSEDDVIRADLIQRWMCQGEIDIRAFEDRHNIYFHEYFSPELEKLQRLAIDGLVTVSATHLTATSRGRLLLRIIAACFDAYLNQATNMQQYSKTI
ncbi:MAG: oxygen-independent coproporphyrinogen III oxidase [Arenimonas sp.]